MSKSEGIAIRYSAFTGRVIFFKFAGWDFLGIWVLELGISAPHDGWVWAESGRVCAVPLDARLASAPGLVGVLSPARSTASGTFAAARSVAAAISGSFTGGAVTSSEESFPFDSVSSVSVLISKNLYHNGAKTRVARCIDCITTCAVQQDASEISPGGAVAASGRYRR